MTTKVSPTITLFPGQLVPVGTMVAFLGATSPAANKTAATATFTFGDTEFDDVNMGTILLTSSDSLSRSYTIRNDYGASADREFNAGASANVAATNLKSVIDSAGVGHGTGRFTVVVDGGQVTITQVGSGSDGNTTITVGSSFENTCDVNPPATFTSGRSDGWLYCDGTDISRTTYATLFDVIGTTYGVGDGSTTFGLPDTRGRFIIGRNDMGAPATSARMESGSQGIDGNTVGAVGGTIATTGAGSEAIIVNWLIRADPLD